LPLVLESTKQGWLFPLNFRFRLPCIPLSAENSSFLQSYSLYDPSLSSRAERASLEDHKHPLMALLLCCVRNTAAF